MQRMPHDSTRCDLAPLRETFPSVEDDRFNWLVPLCRDPGRQFQAHLQAVPMPDLAAQGRCKPLLPTNLYLAYQGIQSDHHSWCTIGLII